VTAYGAARDQLPLSWPTFAELLDSGTAETNLGHQLGCTFKHLELLQEAEQVSRKA
jgi:hypothetical protein